MSLTNLNTFSNPSLDGLTTIDADIINIGGKNLDPTSYVTYTNATNHVDLGNYHLNASALLINSVDVSSQLANKINKSGDTMTGKLTVPSFNISGSTASKIIISDGLKNIVSSAVSSGILDFLIDLSGNVQVQLDGKFSSGGGSINGNVSLGTHKITSTWVPMNDEDLVNRKYVNDQYFITQSALNMALTNYITNSSLATTLLSYVTNSSLSTTLSNYVLSSALSNYVTNTSLSTTLSNYVLSSALSNYVTNTTLTTTLNSYYTKTDIDGKGYLTSSALTPYVTTTSLNTTLGNYLLESGGTLTGQLKLGANRLSSSYVPTVDDDVCNKLYVDSVSGGGISVSGANTWTENNTFQKYILPWLGIGRQGDFRNGMKPNSQSQGTFSVNFCKYGNDTGGNFADGLFLSTWGDDSGGNNNLIMFDKSGKGIRKYRGAGSSNAYFSTYSDCVMTDENSANVSIGGSIAIAGRSDFQQTGINMPTGGCGLNWGQGYSRIVDDGDLQICTDDTMHFKTGSNTGSLGTERVTILQGGNVGIATSSPSYVLDVNGTISTSSGIRFNGAGLNANDKKLYSPADGDLEWMTNIGAGVRGFAVSHQGDKKVYLNILGSSYFNGGNVGIGTTSPSTAFQVWNGVANIHGGGSQWGVNYCTQAGSLVIGDGQHNYGGGSGANSNLCGLLLECADATEIAVHDSGARIASLAYYNNNVFFLGRDMGWGSTSFFFKGEVCIGKVNNLFPQNITYPLWISNGINYYWYLRHYLYEGGVPNHNAYGTWYVSLWLQNAGVTEMWWGTVSDRRIKKNIKPVGNMLDIINKIEVVSFDFVDPTNKRDECGVIAQQLEEVFPNAVDKSTGFIPNVMKYAYRVEKLDDEHLLILFGRTDEELEVGDFIKLVSDTKDQSTKESREHITKILDLAEGGIIVQVWKDYENDKEDFIVYGKRVDDFRNVDKEQLGVMALKGVQELHQIIKQQTEYITSLGERNKLLEQHQSEMADKINQLEEVIRQQQDALTSIIKLLSDK